MSIKKQYSRYVGFALGNILVSYMLLLFLANNLSKQDYAQYGVLASLMSVLLIVVNFGHKEALFKYASQNNQSALLQLTQSLRLWGLLAMVLGLVLMFWSTIVGMAFLAYLCLFSLLLLCAYYRGRQGYWQDAAAMPIYRLFWLLVVWLVVTLSGQLSTLWVFGAASLAALATYMLLGGARLVLAAGGVQGKSWPFFHPVLRNFFLLELATVAYMKLDVLLLKALSVPPAQVAEYFLAVQIFEAAILISAPLSYLFFNQYNRQTDNNKALWLMLKPYLLLLLGLSLVILGGWWLLGQWLLDWMFPNYQASFFPTSILLFALLPMGVNMLLSHLLFAWHKEAVYAKLCGAAFFVCLAMQLLLIPFWQNQGAALARLITELLITVALLGIFQRYRGKGDIAQQVVG